MIHEKALLSPKFRQKVSGAGPHLFRRRSFRRARRFDENEHHLLVVIAVGRPVVPVTDCDHFFAEAHCGAWGDQAFRGDPRAPEFFRIFVETADQQIVKPNAA